MAVIKSVKPRMILDSRGQETLEVDVILDNGIYGRESVPSGAFVSPHEAFRVEDIKKAEANVLILNDLLIGQDPARQEQIDLAMIAHDGTENKSSLGSNVLLAISLACCKAAAQTQRQPLFEYIHQISGLNIAKRIPDPMFNVINGGKHADNNLEFQEFMIVPTGERSYHEKMKIGTDLFFRLKNILHSMGHSIAVGDEGGFAPRLHSNIEALEVLMRTIEESPYEPIRDVTLALDVAAGGIPDLAAVTFPTDPYDFYVKLVNEFPISIIEDPLSEDDWSGWTRLNEAIGSKVLVLGDDLYTTNPARLKIGLERKASNAIVVRPDQIGTLTETFRIIKMAQEAGLTVVISHRSGETESTFIADLAVAVGARYLKAGAPSRGERVAKYNQLLRIEEALS